MRCIKSCDTDRYHIDAIQFDCAIALAKTKKENMQEDSSYAIMNHSKVSAINVFAVKYFRHKRNMLFLNLEY